MEESHTDNNFEGSLYDAFKESFIWCSDAAKRQKETMHFNIKGNAFIKARDSQGRIIQVADKMPQSQYPNVSK